MCAGVLPADGRDPPPDVAAKPTQSRHTGTRSAIVLFARFSGEGNASPSVPSWSGDIFDPDLPGSFSHFYEIMSLGALHVTGEVAPRVYESARPASAYLADSATEPGRFAEFAHEILVEADQAVDFTRFDNDGPDGVPNSGDDDGRVDAVFIILAATPSGFLIGDATGVGHLGFEDDFVTEDLGVDGDPIAIPADRGTLQRGRSFSEAVGSMCHEYGHVLGLPDLYDTPYLQTPDRPPDEDSAGIGAWGLMGWGALGWNRDDGPTSFSGWSRMQLGWAQVSEPSSAQEEMRLEDVGLGGAVHRIPLSGREYFAVEYRTRASTHYDRDLPGEGLLIWHVERALATQEDGVGAWKIDLECADGKWREAGYPQGQTAAPLDGGDNLDFWAHDQAYAQAHSGNLGDGTDPFDGESFAAFTPQSNPSSHSNDGQVSIRLEDIRFEDGVALARTQIRLPQVELTSLSVAGETVLSGARVPLAFSVANRGGMRATGLTARLHTDDPMLEILDAVIELRDLEVDRESLGVQVSEQGFPHVRFRREFEGSHTTEVAMEIYAHGILVYSGVVPLTAVPGYLLSGHVRSEEGEGLPGIPVDVNPFGPIEPSPNPQYKQRAFTDADGSYEIYLPRGRHRAQCRPVETSEWGPSEHAVLTISDDMTFDFTIPRIYHVTGVVRNPEGDPVHSLGVLAATINYGYTPDGYSDFSWSQSSGVYELKLVPGLYVVEARGQSGIGESFPQQDLVEILVESDMVLDLYPRRGVQLTLRVVDEQGEGIAGVRFSVLGDDDEPFAFPRETGLTGGGGIGEVDVLPGAYRIPIDEAPTPFLRGEAMQVVVHGDTTIRVALRRGALVSGRLLDEEGNLIPSTGGSVYLSPMGGGTGTSAQVSPEDATYAVGLVPGRYWVSVSLSGESQFPSQQQDAITVEGDAEINFVLQRGVVVHGDVVDQDGLAVVAGYLQFQPVQGGSGGLAFVEADGAYSRVLIAGTYRVSASLPGGPEHPPSQDLGTFEIVDEAELSLVVRRGMAITGRILDSEGQGMYNLQVTAMSEDRASRNSGATDPDGVFAYRLLPGRQRISLSRLPPAWTTVWELGSFEVSEDAYLEWQRPSGASLHGMVTDSAGLPVQSVLYLVRDPARLTLTDWGNVQVTAYVDTSGQFDIEMDPGRYSVVVVPSGSGARLGRVVADIDIEGDVRLDLVLPDDSAETYRLSGKIVGAEGGESPHVYLQFYEAVQGIRAMWEGSGMEYEVQLPAGEYRVAAGVLQLLGPATEYALGSVEATADMEWDIVLPPVTAIAEAADAGPQDLSLEQNYPNPFNAVTSIAFTVPRSGQVELTVYDLLGQKVRTLVREEMAAGPYVVRWDGRDNSGRTAASGVYICRLTAGSEARTRRLLLIK